MANNIERYQGSNPNGISDIMSRVTVTEAGCLNLAEIKSEDSYTVRLWAKTNSARTAICYIGSKAFNMAITTAWKVFTFTSTAPANSACEVYLPTGTYYIWHAKLEKSTKASDYTQAPEDVDESITQAENDAINASRRYVTDALKEYSTTTQMRSEIVQSSSEIRLSVTEQITETRTYAQSLADAARKGSNTDTDNKLKSYATITLLNSTIKQTADSITATVTKISTDLNSRMTKAESSITQNANNIKLRVEKSNLVSEINQSSGTISMKSNRFTIDSTYFKLAADGTITASNVNLTGSFKTNTTGGYYTHIYDGAIEQYLDNKLIGYLAPAGSSTTKSTWKLHLVCNSGFSGLSFGINTSSGINPYYQIHAGSAYTSVGYRHQFTGNVKFDNAVTFSSTITMGGTSTFNNTVAMNYRVTCNDYINFPTGYGIMCSNVIAFRHMTGTNSGLWVGMENSSLCLTGYCVEFHSQLRMMNDIAIVSNDIKQNAQAQMLKYDSGNKAVNVGNSGSNMWIYGKKIYFNGYVYTPSDVRIKSDITDLDSKYLALIKAIDPITFKYNSKAYVNSKTHTGFIAQQVLSAMNKVGLSPDDLALVSDIYGDGTQYALSYEEFIPLMLKYIRSLEDRINTLESRGSQK